MRIYAAANRGFLLSHFFDGVGAERRRRQHARERAEGGQDEGPKR
jgi:hypothetical protein